MGTRIPKLRRTREQALELAHVACDLRVTYKLGAGGSNPAAGLPMTRRDGVYGCDCSGLVAWLLGYRRGPFSTTGIWEDAEEPGGQFELVQGMAWVGDLLVYPSRYVAGIRTRIGHVVFYTGTDGSTMRPRGVHCSPRNKPSAIAETYVDWMLDRGARFVRYTGWAE